MYNYTDPVVGSNATLYYDMDGSLTWEIIYEDQYLPDGGDVLVQVIGGLVSQNFTTLDFTIPECSGSTLLSASALGLATLATFFGF